ncbi:ABC transporter permease [Methanothermococcus okinawensis]|uniref:ABC3 transporter permease protein domain-containing protein n=1 Tax=Methanothermococcus okinawensis (strain DSM 14208 / JCM 11175 / IH1) TaxID=647113 RepID=F8AM21_METOI|nr:FtsX-like permease family protein [Methanothermococcus okinawensis]AEH06700.1 protein of unknown function DUF214 [Methanothermococcus okinawensis IH1]
MKIYLKMAVRNLKSNRLRTTLAVLGVIIGIFMVTIFGIIGTSVNKNVSNENFANNILILSSLDNQGFTKKDIEIINKLSDKSIPIYSTDNIICLRNGTKLYIKISGIKKGDMYILEKSENIKNDKSNEIPKLTDTSIIFNNITAKRYGLKKGDMVYINNISFRIAGICHLTIPYSDAILSQKTYNRFYGRSNCSNIVVIVNDKHKINNTIFKLKKAMDKNNNKISIITMKDLFKVMSSTLNTITNFLSSIGAISLIISGMGIANITIMGTIERTKEIGIMKSIGASKMDIIVLFLYESAILGAVGSLIGIILSLIVGQIVLYYYGNGMILPMIDLIYILIKSVIIGISISIISALYPAYKASKLNPIEALKYE